MGSSQTEFLTRAIASHGVTETLMDPRNSGNPNTSGTQHGMGKTQQCRLRASKCGRSNNNNASVTVRYILTQKNIITPRLTTSEPITISSLVYIAFSFNANRRVTTLVIQARQ